MKRLIIGLATLLATLSLMGQSRTGEESIDKRLLMEDLKTLEYWIAEAHGDPYRFTSPDSLKQRFIEARAIVDRGGSMKGIDFMRCVMPIVAELRDGHSQVFRPDLDNFYGKLILPTELLFAEDKAYIRRDLNGSKDLRGTELLAVNEVPLDRLLKKFMPLIHRDGNIVSSRLRRMGNPIYLSTLLRVTGLSASEYKLTLRDGKVVRTQVVESLTYEQYKSKTAALNRPKTAFDPISLSFINEGPYTIGKLKISSLNPYYYQDSQEYFVKLFDKLMNEIAEKRVEYLVLDLRDNSGGEDTYVQHVLSYFLKEPFHMYGKLTARKNDYKFLPDGRHWDIDPRAFTKNKEGSYDLTRFIWPELEHTGLDETSPQTNRFKGKVYVLINGGTFSAAADLASIMQHNQVGIFVGEETGGSAIGNVSGYSPTLRLEHSRIQLNLSLFSIKRTFFYTHWTDRGVLPDVTVYPSVDDLIKETDTVLQAALDHIRSERN